jgi:hypothetical protein
VEPNKARKAALTGIDSVYISVSNKQQSADWFVEHFGLVVEGDHLLAGKVEVFLVQANDDQSRNFFTKHWLKNGNQYEMPAICFRAQEIANLYKYAQQHDIKADPLVDRGWFWEFDFYDLDGNKFKAWQPKE